MTTLKVQARERMSSDAAVSLRIRCQESKRNFLGIDLSVLSRDSLIEIFSESVKKRNPLTISFLNPYIVVYAHRDEYVISCMNDFDVVLPDGIGVVWGARFLGIPVSERLGNDDVGADILRVCALEGYSNFLFGSRPGIAERAAANLRHSFPSLSISGTLHGYWFDGSGEVQDPKAENNVSILNQINGSYPDVLWVGLATPIQQKWVYENRDKLNACVVITSGGYIDHLAEKLEWYPPFINELHLSWLYRFVREPRRLWRRYSVEMIAFAWLLMHSKILETGNRKVASK